jgi:hypothetical protein
LNGVNAAVDAHVDPEMPAYQGFSDDCSTVATSDWSRPSMADLLAGDKLKKTLAGHGVSGVSRRC